MSQPVERPILVCDRAGSALVSPSRLAFALQAGVARKNWFDAALWLTRRVEHPCLRRVEAFGPKSYGTHFRLTRPEDLGERFAALVREAYYVGCQEHLKR